MKISLKQALIIASIVLLSFATFAVVLTLKKNAYDNQIVQLQNEVAKRDKTIEVQQGVYQKLTIQTEDLKGLLNLQDAQVKLLLKQLESQGDQLLTANTLIIKLKKDLQSSGHVHIDPIDPAHPEIVHTKLDSKDDFLPFRVKGEVVTDCGDKQKDMSSQASLTLSQVRPLSLTVAVSQGKDGSWRTTTTSSEKNFQIDVALAGVNPYLLEDKWYEKIGMGVDLGVGTNPGLLAGIGVFYQIGKFEFGPKAWVVVDHGTSPYFGAQLLWHPFKR